MIKKIIHYSDLHLKLYKQHSRDKKVLKEAKRIKPTKIDRLEKMYGDYKDTLFRYWDQKGPHNDPHILKLLGLDTRK